MARGHVCPWWIGYLLASPLRRWVDSSLAMVCGYVREGMTVLEPGPGMGFYTIELARAAGPSGRVIAVDIQPRMLQGLRRRAEKAGLGDRIETRLAQPHSMELGDWAGKVDFTLASSMVHEVGSSDTFFQEVSAALKPGGHLLLLEPKGHVKAAAFEGELNSAGKAGLRVAERLKERRFHTALLQKDQTPLQRPASAA